MTLEWKGKFDTSKVKPKFRAGAVAGLHAALEHGLQVSNGRVPNEEGTLERSGQVNVDEGSLTGGISYGTKYAVPQHENLTYHHPGGRQAKYLETAMHDEAKVMAQILAAQIRRAAR